VYAFVEGEQDRVFYEFSLGKYVPNMRDIFVYNCDGKKHVFDAYRNVMSRYPACSRVFFFVDKDVDDILGQQLPSNPRIFTTDCYSIENYLVSGANLTRYFSDFTKIRRVELDLRAIEKEFEDELKKFYALVLPIMAWIILMRRTGNRVVLTDVNMDELFQVRNGTIARKSKRRAIHYLHRVTQLQGPLASWRSIRLVCSELKKLEPKQYVRGKFAAWCFVRFAIKFAEDIQTVVKEGNGSMSQFAQLNEGNFVQLLAPRVPTPPLLDEFLGFHLPRSIEAEIDTAPSRFKKVLRKLAGLLGWVTGLGL
jgi:hypothetical protein